MAKKKEKVVIIDKELTPTVLATIEEKKLNFIGLILLFAIFGTVVFFLPNISSYIDNLRKQNDIADNPSNPIQSKPNDDVVEIEHYPYSNTLNIKTDIFYLNNFQIGSDSLSFDINNNQNTSLKMDDYNYYLEIYSSKDMLLQRIKIDDLTIEAKNKIKATYKLNNTSEISYFTFMEIGVDEYNAYTAKADDNGLGMLVCAKDNEVITYSLKNNKLYLIEDSFTISTLDESYRSTLSTYQNLMNTYNNINGVTSTMNLEENSLKFTTKMDLNMNEKINVNKIVYPKDTDAKVMRFELMAKGYNCK